jgi:phosphoglycerol transferase MdoB-like AlkP superfamily enzyme
VVLLHLESFAAHKTGIFGNALAPTPVFDRLANEGILFERFYAPAENTSRAILALLFGLVDLSPGSRNTATRNPRLVDQRTLVNALEGYSKHYFLGGTADWAQIRATLKHNIQGLQVREQGDFASPSVDVWGLADADMLRESDGFLRTAKEPFFALVQTAGNHPPFTIPGHLGFQTNRPTAAQLEAASFVGLEEYQALRLMDWSLGRFFEQAKTSPWFKNTIFVIYGDHGVARGNRDPRYGDLALASHHVPLLIYAPGLLKPERIHTTCSQVDLMPTLLGLLGVDAENRTLGRNALDRGATDRGVAMTFTPFLTPPAVGLVRGDAYLNLDPSGTLHLYDLKDAPARDLSREKPLEAQELAELARAIRVWSNYLIHHNQP